MNTKHFYLLLLTLTTCISIHSMEQHTPKLPMPVELAFPIKEIWLNVIARCSAKWKLRETCKYFHHFASIANDEIFLQNPLVMDQKLLKDYAFYYAELDNYGVICNLLDQGLNPNTFYANEEPLLTYAVINQNLTMVDALLKHPLFVVDTHTYRSFNAALKLTNSAIAQRILTLENIDIKKVFDSYFDCASDQNIDILTHMLSLKIDNLSLARLLRRAAEEDHIKMATLLLKHNIDLNSDYYFYYGRTPVDIAAENNNTRMLKLLVKHGANLNGARIDYPPLKRAIYFGHLNSIRFLLNCGAPLAMQPTLLTYTIGLHENQCQRKIEIVHLLLNKGMDVNEKTVVDYQAVQIGIREHGDSALSIATRWHHIDAMKVLLAHPEINVNIKTDNDKTPLDIAIEKRNSYLHCHCGEQHSIDANYCGRCGKETSVGQYSAIIQLLTEHGAKSSSALQIDGKL